MIIGVPRETDIYDQNRRWLSEVIDFNSAKVGRRQFE